MKKLKTISLIILLVSLVLCKLQAQTSAAIKWWNPADEKFAVVEGQASPKEVNSFYDRLPARAEKLVRQPVWELSHNTAGECINFKTSATNIIIRYTVKGDLAMPHMPATGVSGVDLYARDINGQWQWAKGSWNFGDTIEYRFSNLSLSSKEEEFRLYLPLYNTVSWMNIGVSADATFSPLAASDEQPIVAYGTSIMQGACASRPGLAWTNILQRKLDRPVINLGFSGNGQLEEPLINLINEINAKLFVLDCMPNLVDTNRFSKADIQRRIQASVKALQQQHPQTPILLTEHCDGLPGTNMDTMQLKRYKVASNMLASTFALLQQEGIKNIFLLTDEAIGFNNECTIDGTHPNDIGMMKYADAYETIIRSILHEEKGSISTTIPLRQRRDHATYDFMQRHEAVIATVKEKQPAVILIGNSITHFWGGLPEAGINRGISSWEKYLAPLNTVNLGFGWDRIENVLWRVYHGELDNYKAKKILLTIGTNNLGYNTDDEIIKGLQHLLKAIRQRQPTAAILLSGIYPRRDMETRVELLNKKMLLLAKSMKLTFVNPGTKLLMPNKKINEKMFSDGLHPNEEGYEKLGAALSLYLK